LTSHINLPIFRHESDPDIGPGLFDLDSGKYDIIRSNKPADQWLGVPTTLMKCRHCDSEAKAVCVFCGRAVCATHRQAKDYYVGYGEKHARALLIASSPTAADVRDASWCGVCEVDYAETY
jgi:hypothetical protein